MTEFPPNPSDKMIFEKSPGIFFQYDKGSNTWTRLQGLGPQFTLATPLTDGLMSKEDLRKLNALLVPPPRTTLTSPSCRFTFEEGIFGFRSSQKHLFIESELDIVTTDTAGDNVVSKKLWKIHENTYGLDFRINLPLLLSELEIRGQLNYHKTVGPAGKQGIPGKQGINQLDTGPRGVPGKDGANAPFPGSLSTESIGTLPPNQNRAIVDIYTHEVSPNENYLVAVRANIGNSTYCPSRVRPRNLNTKWIVATDERPVARNILPCDAPTQRTACPTGPGCAPGANSISNPQTALVQNFCSTRLYYFDISSIEADILARFEEQLAELKQTKEKLVLEWLKIMIQVYNEQKLAICCAIENCESKRENTRNRQYIETQRVQGAQAHVQISVEGAGGKDEQLIETLPGAVCPPKGPLDLHDQGLGSSGGTGALKCVVSLAVSCSTNSPDEAHAVTGTLLAGVYDVEASHCCCYSSTVLTEDEYLKGLADINNIKPADQAAFKAATPYSGVVGLAYQGPHGELKLFTPDHGSFHTQEQAQKAYAGKKFQITHSGGKVSAWFPKGVGTTKALGNSGLINVCFSKAAISLNGPAPREIARDIPASVDPCAKPFLELDIQCHLNTNSLSAVVANIPAGEYVAELTDCCCGSLVQAEVGVVTGLTGLLTLQYISADGPVNLQNPDMGSFSDLTTALNIYLGNSFGFTHKGGDIRAWTNANNPGGNSGSLRLTIRTKACVDVQPPAFGTGTSSPIFPTFSLCEMTLDQILFYEAGWKSKACCGAYVDVGGVRWLVVQRSIGNDTSCGGGESAQSDCIVKAHQYGFYPAVAFPTVDGRHFFGKPTSGFQPMFRENGMETLILEQIQAGSMLAKAGDPTKINAILFPQEV